jgi:hypothetical protein
MGSVLADEGVSRLAASVRYIGEHLGDKYSSNSVDFCDSCGLLNGKPNPAQAPTPKKHARRQDQACSHYQDAILRRFGSKSSVTSAGNR